MKFYCRHFLLVGFFVEALLFSVNGLARAQVSSPVPASPVETAQLVTMTPLNIQHVKYLMRLGLGVAEQVLWSPDGKLLAICGMAGIWLYRVDMLDSPPRLLEDNTSCQKLAFSPDGLWVASIPMPIFETYTVQVWEIETGKLQAELHWAENQPGSGIYTIAFSPDSSRLAFGGDIRVEVWDFKNNSQEYFLPSCGSTYGVAFSPDGRLLAATQDCGTNLWDSQTGERKLNIGISGTNIVFSPDGKTLAVNGGDNVRLLDITGGQRAVLLNGEPLFSVYFSSDSKKVITGNTNAVIEWDARQFTRVRVAENPIFALDMVVINPDHSLAAGIDGSVGIGAGLGQVVVWEIGQHNPKTTLDFTNGLRWVTFNPVNLTLAYGDPRAAWLWDFQSNTQKKLTPSLKSDQQLSFSSGTFSGDGRTISVSFFSGHYEFWDVASGKELGIGKDEPSGDLSPDGTVLAVVMGPSEGYPNDTIVLIDFRTGTVLRALTGHTDMIRSIAFSVDGKLLASSANDLTLRLWDTTTGSEKFKISSSQGYFETIAFSPDSTEFATTSSDAGAITFWDAKTGQSTKTVRQPITDPLVQYVTALKFSRDGRILASGGSDGNIYLWDVAAGALINTLAGHLNEVFDVDFSSDDKLLASASADGTVRVWGVVR